MPDRDVPRVLVIDDDVRVRHFLTTALGAAGFAVTATGTGEEGLRLAASRPELVVLDVELPDLSGREVCRRLKAAEDTATIPVLMLSGVFTAAVDRSEALEDGSDAYLTKPVTSRELVAMARALLRTARAERRSHEHQRAAEELRRRVAQSKAMVDVARSITASLDLQGVLDRIVDEACLLLAPAAWPSPCWRPARSRCRSSASAPCAGCRRASRSGCARSAGAMARRPSPSASADRSGRRTSSPIARSS